MAFSIHKNRSIFLLWNWSRYVKLQLFMFYWTKQINLFALKSNPDWFLRIRIWFQIYMHFHQYQRDFDSWFYMTRLEFVIIVTCILNYLKKIVKNGLRNSKWTYVVLIVIFAVGLIIGGWWRVYTEPAALSKPHQYYCTKRRLIWKCSIQHENGVENRLICDWSVFMNGKRH